MIKFRVQGDETNQVNFSSHIIVNSINNAAKKLGLYAQDGICVQYDSLCQFKTPDVQAFISSYEIAFPRLIINNSKNLPILGVSRDNLQNILDGGKPEFLAGYFPLGVDSELWPIIPKTEDLSSFNCIVYTESLIRSGIDICIEAFGLAFRGNPDCKLCLKDRNALPEFRTYVEERAKALEINIEYINEKWNVTQIQDYLRKIDCQLYLNRGSTYALPPQELMTASLPSIVIAYSGPRDYCTPDKNALCPKFEIRPVEEDMGRLIAHGARNFFLMDGYTKTPVWAVADIEDTARKLLTIKENENNINQSLAANARKTASEFTWENSALKLKEQLERWF